MTACRLANEKYMTLADALSAGPRGETLTGATRFASGVGRHGAFGGDGK
jgi:hypothetical protein